MSILVIPELDHVEQHGEENGCHCFLVEDNFVVNPIEKGAGPYLGCFQGGHDVGFLLHAGQVHLLHLLISLLHLFLISDYVPVIVM